MKRGISFRNEYADMFPLCFLFNGLDKVFLLVMNSFSFVILCNYKVWGCLEKNFVSICLKVKLIIALNANKGIKGTKLCSIVKYSAL